VFPFLAEAGHVLRIVIRVTEKMTPDSEREALLSQCIVETTDDTMAFQILTILTKKMSDSDLRVSFAQLYPAFIKRMRQRYGRNVDAANIDLSTSAPRAFNLWGTVSIKDEAVTVDPEDRAIQYDFWRRYIGNSNVQFAQAFEGFFMPIGLYQEDPALPIENKIPVADLRKFYDELPNDEPLSEREHKSLRRLKRLLDGDFKNGFDPAQWDDPSANSMT
jgi:hypothetical protein